MNDKLDIIVDGKPVRTIEAEIHESEQVGPRKFSGRLLGVSVEDLLEFLDPDRNVEVLFHGRVYKFAELERDGTFELSLAGTLKEEHDDDR